MHFLSDLAPVLVLAAILGVLLARVGQPPLLGYLVAGILAGPHAFRLVAHPEAVGFLGELGVALLLFDLGLELSWRKVAPVAGRSAALTLAVAGIPFLVLYNLLLLWGEGTGAATLLAFALSMSSTAIGVQTLELQGSLAARAGVLAVGVLLLEDVLAVLALALFGVGAGGLPVVGRLLLQLAGFAAACATIGLYAVPRALDAIHRRAASRTLLPVFLIALGIGMAWAGSRMGVPIAVGAFLAGSLAAEARCREDLGGYLHPVKELFIAFFFVAVGFSIRPGAFLEVAPLALVLVVLLALLRPVAASSTAFVLGEEGATSLALGAALLPVGEFSFLLVSESNLAGPVRERLLALTGVVALLLAPLAQPGLRLVPALRTRIEGMAPGAIRHLLVIVRGAMAPSVSPFPPPGRELRSAFADLGLSGIVIAGIGVGVAGTSRYLDSVTPPWLDFRLLGFVVGAMLVLPALVHLWSRWRRVLSAILGKEREGPGTERIRMIQRATRGALTVIALGLVVLALFPLFYLLGARHRGVLGLAAALLAGGLAFSFRGAVTRLHSLLEEGMRGAVAGKPAARRAGTERGPAPAPPPAAPPAAPAGEASDLPAPRSGP